MKPLLALLCCCLPFTLCGGEADDLAFRRDYLERENHVDFRAYQLTTRQRLDWAVTRNGFAGSLGSISMERFYHETELRLYKEVAPWFEVFLRQQQTEFAGPQPAATEVGLFFGGAWRGGLLGSPVHEKRGGDLGYALQYGHPQGQEFLRLSWINQDVFYNEKNVRSPNHEPAWDYTQTPITRRLEAGLIQPGQLWQVTWEAASSARREARGSSLEWEGSQGGFKLDGYLGEFATGLWHVRWQGQGRQQRALRKLLWAQQEISSHWAELAYDLPLSPQWRVEAGAAQMAYRNQIQGQGLAEDYHHQLITNQAFGFFEYDLTQGNFVTASLQVGQVDLQQDWQTARKPFENGVSTELKAGLGYLFYRQQDASLHANSTWDVDALSSRKWDGGSVTLVLGF